MPSLAADERALNGDGNPEIAEGQVPLSSVSRREFLQYGAAGLALASQALAACSRAPAEKIVPYRVQPSEIVPGRPLYYATATTLDGYATGLLVESHEGRPTKIEGNLEHPASLGATSAIEQALLLDLYDPRRLRSELRAGSLAGALSLPAWLHSLSDPARQGRGVHLVMPPQSSPLIRDQLARVRERLPGLSLHYHAPLGRAAAWAGSRRAFGTSLDVRADLRRATVVVAFDADILGGGPSCLPLARAFAERRAPDSAAGMNRLYVMESAMSITGQTADHRLSVSPSQIARLVAALLVEVARALGNAAPEGLASALASAAPVREQTRFVQALARDLLNHRGASAVFVGDEQAPAVHAAVHALNVLLGNTDTVLTYAPPVVLGSDDEAYGTLRPLRDALASGAVESLLLFDADIAYASPADLNLSLLLRKAKESAYFGLTPNRTSAACTWQIPAAHPLESWLDTRAFDGTISIVQPLIAPLYAGRTLSELLGSLLAEEPSSAHDTLLRFWTKTQPREFDEFWQTTLSRGIVADSAVAPIKVPALSWSWLPELETAASRNPGLELRLARDPRLHDGRFAHNEWLLELPCPITRLTWDNAAWFAPAHAEQLGIANGDVVRLVTTGGPHALEVPALIVPGQSEGAISLALGWGQKEPGGEKVVGVDAYCLLTSDLGLSVGVRVERTARRAELALSQTTISLDPGGEDIVQSSTLLEHQRKKPAVARGRKQLSLYEGDAPKVERQWGMTIDLNVCTGCSACVVACQAENNIPTVGKSGVLAGRAMHWLRIDRYLAGERAAPRVLLQPMLCQHCEKAPCEYVCPTAATVHSADGLNQMVYNRCVGTRFCSNNCPYKVRRFNWFNYHEAEGSPRELAHNPEVTVRARGVMEKCTYCVQRIRSAEIRARVEHRPLRGESVETACEQACPTRAIAFGDINERSSKVAQLRNSERAFEVLSELGSSPRTRYLMKLSNPNPELA